MAPSDASRISLTIEQGVATIALVREARLNAFDEEMHEALRHALDQIDGDASVRAIVLTGSGRAFSAGQDLGERAASFARGEWPDLAVSLEHNYGPLIRRIVESPLPVVVAVNGIAFGAGAALALAGDIVLAAQSARFQFGFINVGLGPDSGASWTLPRAVGQAVALDLALTGRAVLAQEALAIRLVSRVVPDEGLRAEAIMIARELAKRSPEAVSAIKRLVRRGLDCELDEVLAAERDNQTRLGRSEAYREAVLRFSRPRN
jgi:2-(1,2-epoxy-1,2-dihydrophenyl)acetyl-CoA isomerase